MRVYVGGSTAIFNDFSEVLTGKLPLFIAVIVGLGFLLLLVAFRSIVVPLTAAVMNLLAAGASFGVVVAFFQFGWGSEALGLGRPGPIEAFLPVLMLAILFGLSMDYQVFLVSRMHEEWVHTREQPARGHHRPGLDRPGDHRRRDHHDLRVPGLRVRRPAGHRRVRHRPGERRVHRRVHPAYGTRPGADAPVRQRELVAARSGWTGCLPHLSVEPADDAIPADSPEPVGAARH